jgi:DNA-binding ferritin-like protein
MSDKPEPRDDFPNAFDMVPIYKAKGDDDSSTPAKPSERISGSDRNPEGSASGSRGGIEISEAQEKALKKKAEDHNEKHGDKKGKKVNLGMLKAVYRRGAGAFSTSHRPGMGRQQWAMARVNAFLYLVRNGKPENAKYTTDYDLLPKGHPKRSEKKSFKPDQARTYEWPEEVRKYRLMVEGLDDDLIRYKAEIPSDDDGGDADQNIRRRERQTPAQRIEAASRAALESVAEVLDRETKSRAKTMKLTGKLRVREMLRKLLGPKEKLIEDLTKAYVDAADGGGTAGLARINDLLLRQGIRNVSKVDVRKILKEAMTDRAKFMANSLIDETVTNFAESTEVGETIDQIAKRIQMTREASPSRARTIARTESAAAYHDGQIAAWKEVGFVQKKHFLAAGGACEFCKAVEDEYGIGKKSLPIDEPFIKAGSTIVASSGKTLTAGIDMQGTVHPNCRCDFIAAEID